MVAADSCRNSRSHLESSSVSTSSRELQRKRVAFATEDPHETALSSRRGFSMSNVEMEELEMEEPSIDGAPDWPVTGVLSCARWVSGWATCVTTSRACLGRRPKHRPWQRGASGNHDAKSSDTVVRLRFQQPAHSKRNLCRSLICPPPTPSAANLLRLCSQDPITVPTATASCRQHHPPPLR